MAKLPRLAEMVTQMARADLRFIVPMIRNGDRDDAIAGTGTLLRVAGEPFVVTASHVAKLIDTKGGFFVPSMTENRRVGVDGQGVLAVDDDKHDVAIYRLAGDAAAQLERGGFEFVTTHRIETVSPPELSEGHCLVVGFPQVLVRTHAVGVEYGPQGFICELASPTNAGRLSSSYDPEHHFLLHYRETATDVQSWTDERRIHPGGMSGGSVWWLGIEADERPLEQRLLDVRWIGVQSGAYGLDAPRDGFLKACSLRSAAALMAQQWPDLHPAFQLHRPAVISRKPWK